LVVKLNAVAADEIALLIPKHLLCGRIDGGDDSGLICHDDAERRAGDDGFIEVEGALQILFVLMTRSDVGDRCRDTIRQLHNLNLITCKPGFGLEGRSLDLDECGFSGLSHSLVAFEEIGSAYRGKNIVEIVS